jgi:hypothetical protein
LSKLIREAGVFPNTYPEIVANPFSMSALPVIAPIKKIDASPAQFRT